jgi:hypothetical protein
LSGEPCSWVGSQGGRCVGRRRMAKLFHVRFNRWPHPYLHSDILP